MVRVIVQNKSAPGAYAYTKPLNRDPISGEARSWGPEFHANGSVIELRKPVRADRRKDPKQRHTGAFELNLKPSEIDDHFKVIDIDPVEALEEAKADQAAAAARVKAAKAKLKVAEDAVAASDVADAAVRKAKVKADAEATEAAESEQGG